MGTGWMVLLDAPLDSARLDQIRVSLVTELERINKLMSTWDPSSELSRFNSLASQEPQALHTDTLALIDAALQISRLTDGAYDITLQPLGRLWGFGAQGESHVVAPDATALAAIAPSLGYRQIVRLDQSVRKRHPALMLDLSSIAKGYAVDQLGRLLEQYGVQRYLVDIGGEIRTRTGVPGTRLGKPWHVGVEQPDGAVPAGLLLRDAQVATSGSYRQYRHVGGQRVSHLFDGRTLTPVQHALAAVTVLHDTTAQADAWATALMVLGEDEGWQMAHRQGLEVQFIVHAHGRFQVRQTAGFAALASTQPQ